MIDKKFLINELQKFIIENDLEKALLDTKEWHLFDSIKIYVQALETVKNKNDIKDATNIYAYFCMQNLWGTDLYKKCTKFAEIGYKLAGEINS